MASHGRDIGCVCRRTCVRACLDSASEGQGRMVRGGLAKCQMVSADCLGVSAVGDFRELLRSVRVGAMCGVPFRRVQGLLPVTERNPDWSSHSVPCHHHCRVVFGMAELQSAGAVTKIYVTKNFVSRCLILRIVK